MGPTVPTIFAEVPARVNVVGFEVLMRMKAQRVHCVRNFSLIRVRADSERVWGAEAVSWSELFWAAVWRRRSWWP